MKILVLGATGMAGHTIAILLKELGHDITAFSRRRFNYCNNILGDVTNFVELKKIIHEGNYDAIINSVGILNQYAEENQSSAVLINSYLPHFLSKSTNEMNTKVVHMSTDCVFSGKTGGYIENSLRDGETFYDRSKALGELDNDKDLTFRNSIIGPDLNVNGIGLFNWFMKQKGQVKGFKSAIWSGVTTITLARAIDKALTENLTGIYNLVNNNVINKYELLNLFNANFKKDAVKLTPDFTLKIDKSLVNTRGDFSFVVPNYEQMISEMKEWIYNHKDLYPHYFN